MNTREKSRRNFLSRCWGGEARLWQAFWLLNVLGKIVVFVVVGAVGATLWRFTRSPWLIDLPLGAVLAGYIGLVAVSVWRCAPNTDTPAFSALAKLWVPIYVLSMALLVVEAIKG